jgi:Reverse transcriptase (RNA-dependent DNA polymerase)
MAIIPEKLVTKGLLPENLPPVYTAQNIWSAFSQDGTTYAVTAKMIGEPCVYNASKRGGQRRLFDIPHPAFVRDQGLFFEKHWTHIEALFEAAIGSLSRPTVDSQGARHVHVTSHQELPRLRLKRLSRFRFCLVTDVSRFFPSVYTHTLSWAINGKFAAKTDTQPNSAVVFGYRLDFIIRQAQSRQTIGIPVGPDASKIVAEILMSAVDKRFLELSGKSVPAYVRHVDDYWVGGHTHEECEKHLQKLCLALKEYQLDINESKTRIISTKYVFGESWPSEFESELQACLGSDGQLYGLDPVSTFGKIVDRATRDNDDGIIKHILRVMDDRKLWSLHWDVIEHFLVQCAVQFPHSFDYVARVIAWRLRTNLQIDKSLWLEIARLTALQASRLGRDSETAWAMWLIKELKQKITIELSDAILGNCGGLVLCFLAHFRKHNLATDKKLYERMRGAIEGNPFAGAFWPLTLELCHLNEADLAWSKGTTPKALRALHDAKVSMINWNAPPRVFVEVSSGDDGGGPDYAIEDYGLEYGERKGKTDDFES